MSNPIPESELIINPDGSIYHLNIRPEDIATDIITVGDPDRVDMVAKRLDKIEITKHKREFKTITGTVAGKRVTIISTGIGTDNIDIVFTELDALANIDMNLRMPLPNIKSLNFYRIGTSGALRSDIDVDSIIISAHAIGLESLMHYYNFEQSDFSIGMAEKVRSALMESLPSIIPYGSDAATVLLDKYSSLGQLGVTVTATGFYGPQGRKILATPRNSTFLDNLAILEHKNYKITNLEMETAGIYGMASLLGHNAISFNAILANRATQKFSSNPKKTVAKLVDDFFLKFTS